MKLRTVACAATIALAALALLAGCKKGDSNANGANTRNAANTSNTTTTTNAGTTTPLGTPTSTASAATPAEALLFFYEAVKRKDGPAVKALFSRSTIKMLEERAEKEKKSFDDVFNETLTMANQELPPTPFESRDEKVNGDRATLEVHDVKQGSWDTVHFVKEGGWKLDFTEGEGGGDTAGGDDDAAGSDHKGGH